MQQVIIIINQCLCHDTSYLLATGYNYARTSILVPMDQSLESSYCFLLASLITDAKWELISQYDHPVQLSHNQVQFVLPGENPGCITITDNSFSMFFHVGIAFPEDVTSTDVSKICEDICPKIQETIFIGIRNASL